VEAAELDEMWSFVGSKRQQRWLWHAIDHHTGQVLAYVFGTREDETFLRLKELLAPFGITHFYTDGWGAYRRHIDPDKHTVGKQHTQKIERKHTTLRARIKRLVRKTICFSKSIQMHDLVIGLFINRFAYGRAIDSQKKIREAEGRAEWTGQGLRDTTFLADHHLHMILRRRYPSCPFPYT
jgi:insertion element IS1 protein InsB